MGLALVAPLRTGEAFPCCFLFIAQAVQSPNPACSEITSSQAQHHLTSSLSTDSIPDICKTFVKSVSIIIIIMTIKNHFRRAMIRPDDMDLIIAAKENLPQEVKEANINGLLLTLTPYK